MNFGTDIPEDDISRAGLLDRVTLPWRDALAATAEQTFVHNPIAATIDAFGLAWAGSNPEQRRAMFAQQMGEQDLSRIDMDFDFGKADEYQDPKTLNAQYGQSLGLTFDRPTRAGAVSIMVRRKQEEIARQASLNRAPGGLTYGIANFATMLAVSATDPLNVASAFIPIVPEARAALWTAKYGKTAARAFTGGIEGAVGAAGIEPINYGAAQYLGDDYTMGDSLINVALGTVLGGGLHVGFGAVSDFIGRMAPETRDATLRGALANMAEGRPVQVDHIVLTDPLYRRFDELPTVQGLRLASDEARLMAEVDALDAQIKALPPGDPKAEDLLARLDAVESQLRQPDLAPEVQRQLSTRRDELLTDTTPEKLREQAKPLIDRRAAEAQKARVAEELSGLRRRRTEADVQAALTPPQITAAAEAASRRFRGLYPDRMQEPAAMLAAQREASLALTRAADQTSAAALDQARTASVAYGRNVERSTAVPPQEASTAADRYVKEAQGDDLDIELQEASATIDAMEKQGALTPEEAAQARSGKEGIAEAAKRGRAARAAAACLLLHP
jgi:hypothetical protein